MYTYIMNDIRRRDYEEWWKKTENVNRLLLASFEKDMAGLSDAVRKRHVANVKVFIIEYFS